MDNHGSFAQLVGLLGLVSASTVTNAVALVSKGSPQQLGCPVTTQVAHPILNYVIARGQLEVARIALRRGTPLQRSLFRTPSTLSSLRCITTSSLPIRLMTMVEKSSICLRFTSLLRAH